MTAYFTVSEDELEQFLLDFMTRTTKLPDLGLTEVTDHADTGRIWPEYVPDARKWSEMAALLRDRGWSYSSKLRRLSYVGDGKYETRQTQRWAPPAPQDSHDS